MGKMKVPTDTEKEKKIKDRRRAREEGRMQNPDSRYW